MRSITWITVLVGLFMFQSLWNVAAAFCVHKEQAQVQQLYHFGHHQNNLCVSDDHLNHAEKNSDQLKVSDNDLNIGEDHQDHLPSMMHLYLKNEKFDVVNAHLELTVIPQFYWMNSYQPPDLFHQSPPPEFSPLMVG